MSNTRHIVSPKTRHIIRADDGCFYCIPPGGVSPKKWSKIISTTTYNKGLQLAYILNLLHGNEPTSAQQSWVIDIKF